MLDSVTANTGDAPVKGNLAQITNPGGLWDESQNFYPRLGGIPHLGAREWRWSRGSGQHPGDHLLAEDASALARRSGAE
jgi:hypothetical protein